MPKRVRDLVYMRLKVKEWRAKVQERIRLAKSKPCADCGVQYPYYIMQFDHVRGVKEFGLARTTALGKSVERIYAEIAKCDVVCANCHAARSWKRL